MGTNYYRALTTPLTPVILAGIALGYDAARLTLAAPTPSDAPIAYYMVANLTTGLTTKVVAYPSTTLSVMGLQPQTSYSFQVSAVSIDGSSSTSLISPTITTGALPVVVVAPAFTLSSSSETRTVNTAATGFTINSTGGAIASFAINATPPGMSFSTSTGALTGTPTSVAGATAYTITATNATGSATATFTLTVTAVPIVISVAAIAGVTAPITGATPVSTTTAGTGYTGTVTWSGSPETFASETTYTATITLTPTAGYTLTGVSANFFTVAGATAVTHSANSGVITAVFYMVGSTGPGGGKIFYVAATPFACGPTRAVTCTYLEAAPSGWANGGTPANDPTITWATNVNSNQTTAVTGADQTAIGYGYQNSLAIVAQAGNVADTSAAVAARNYTGGSKTDWYLPSRDELNQMCKWARGQAWGSDATICSVYGAINSGAAAGFVEDGYWSSSEYSSSEYFGNVAWYQTFYIGRQNGAGKDYTLYVRPVRAF